MIEKSDISFLTSFILERKYRLHRNLILQLIILIMSLEVFFDAETSSNLNLSTNRIYSWIGYLFIINLVMYVNMYILVPLFLIKNRLLAYSAGLFFTTLLIMPITMIMQSLFNDAAVVTYYKPSNLELFFSLTSSLLSILLLIMGTSSLLVFKHWIHYGKRALELESATLETELKFLKSQINPHFLFNMLNNANIMVDEDPELSSKILIKLDDLLRYQINDSTKDKVLLSADILFLTDFLDLEKTRRDLFDYTISKEGHINNVKISPMLFIPFVENAVKHNSDSEQRSYVNISFTLQNKKLTFICENSKPKTALKRQSGGLGLINIKRRLDLLYNNSYTLEVEETETTYIVNLILNL